MTTGRRKSERSTLGKLSSPGRRLSGSVRICVGSGGGSRQVSPVKRPVSKPVFLLLSEAVGFGVLAECLPHIWPLLHLSRRAAIFPVLSVKK